MSTMTMMTKKKNPCRYKTLWPPESEHRIPQVPSTTVRSNRPPYTEGQQVLKTSIDAFSYKGIASVSQMKAFIVLAFATAVAHGGFLGGGGGGGGFGGGGHEGGFGGGGDHGGDGYFSGAGVIEPRTSNAGQDEDNAALSAVGLARMLGASSLSGHGGHGGESSGATYTISGPTQVIKSVHKITTTNAGGQVLSRSAGSGGHGGGGQSKIIIIKSAGGSAGHGGHGGNGGGGGWQAGGNGGNGGGGWQAGGSGNGGGWQAGAAGNGGAGWQAGGGGNGGAGWQSGGGGNGGAGWQSGGGGNGGGW